MVRNIFMADDVIARLKDVFDVEQDIDLADAMGIKRNTISGWRARGAVPSGVLKKVSEEKRKSLDWLTTGSRQSDEPLVTVNSSASKSDTDPGLVRVPLYDVRAAAGGGALTAENPELIQHFDFPEWWLRSALQVTPGTVQVLLAWGDSMKPDVLPGDLLIVDTSHTSIRADALYVFEMDGGVFIKKLQRLPGGKLKVISTNEAYEPYTIAPNGDPSFKVVGRVAFHGKVM